MSRASCCPVASANLERCSEARTSTTDQTVSPDGNLLATSDARRAVKIHTTSSPTLTYQVTAQDFVLDLAFSPDLRRIYDLRGDYALEPSPVGRLYCCSTGKGVVTLHDALRGTFTNYMSGHDVDIPNSIAATVSPSQTHALERVLVTHDRKRILIQLAAAQEGAGEKILLFLEASPFFLSAATQQTTSAATVRGEPKVISPNVLDTAVSSQISLVRGFSPSNAWCIYPGHFRCVFGICRRYSEVEIASRSRWMVRQSRAHGAWIRDLLPTRRLDR
uniref:Uncharacterized protein n=1 Tax=Pyricularia oryzae (strain P131) TaxID=1143193 RepID=L7JFB0_PYRO1